MSNKRNTFLLIRINDEEREQIQARMELAGTKNMSAFIRKMAIDGRIILLDMDEIKTLVSLMRRTSANVNQIAKRVNSTGDIYRGDITELRERLGEIWQLQRTILSTLR